MYIEDLLTLFSEITEEFQTGINIDEYLVDLKSEIEKKKYDLQDQAIIETIVKEDRESFSDALKELLDGIVPDGTDKVTFLNSLEGRKQVVDAFIKSLEHSVDYFYNEIISKQFSGS